MNEPLRPHIGHHIMSTITVKKLVVGLDLDKEKIMWSENAAEEIRKAVLEFVEDKAEEIP